MTYDVSKSDRTYDREQSGLSFGLRVCVTSCMSFFILCSHFEIQQQKNNMRWRRRRGASLDCYCLILLLLLIQCEWSVGFKPAPATATLVFNETATASSSLSPLVINQTEFVPRGLPKTDQKWSPTRTTTRASAKARSAVKNTVQSSFEKKHDDDVRLLLLLRAYEQRHSRSAPTHSSNTDACRVLRDMVRHLYAAGAPSWVLETVMEHAAAAVWPDSDCAHFFVLPNRCFIVYSSSSSSSPNNGNNVGSHAPPAMDLFPIQAGYDMARLGAAEQVAIRLASFGSRQQQAHVDDDDLCYDHEWLTMQTQAVQEYLTQVNPTAEELAHEILRVASMTSNRVLVSKRGIGAAARQGNTTTHDNNGNTTASFWNVSDSTRDLWTRLVTDEAAQALTRITQTQNRPLYPRGAVSLCRFVSAAGACAMWFGGSWYDMIVAGSLAVWIAAVEKAIVSREKRLLTEVVASFGVGFMAGSLALIWPDRFSFGSIAISAIMDILQGYKMVYAVIEVMSRNMVAGASRLIEAILFTGLVSYTLMFGFDMACRLTGNSIDYARMLDTPHAIHPDWLPVLLPFAAVAWSGLFRPLPQDLPLMACHGMLAFALTQWVGAPVFVAAMCVTFSAGVISHFTGREALGNTVAGLYALVPGCMAVRLLITDSGSNFLERVLVTAAKIGLGGWTGTLLGRPIILGETAGWNLYEGKRSKTMFCF